MAKFRPLPPLAELREAFDYDPETGVLTRRASVQNPQLVGKPAGWLTPTGYIYVRVCGKKAWPAHRIIWYLVTEEDPQDFDIDHIDQCKSNNKFSNLRKATRSQNRSNHSQRGWGFHKKTGKYQAYICQDGKQFYLGLFLTAEEARAAYDAKAVELRGEFAPQECRQDSA